MSRRARMVIYYLVLVSLIAVITYFFGFVLHTRTWSDVVLHIVGQILAQVALFALGRVTGFFRWSIHGFWLPGWRPCVCLDGRRVRGCSARAHRVEEVS